MDVGPFNAPKVGGSSDTITDLAVAPDNTIYVISNTELYTADPSDGHVTAVGAVTACGSDNVALTTTPDGNLYAGDFKGAFCKIDLSTTPPTVTQVGTLGNNIALSGDLVAVGDGTIYGSAYDTTKSSTANDNYLVTIDPTTGAVIKNIGSTQLSEPLRHGVTRSGRSSASRTTAAATSSPSTRRRASARCSTRSRTAATRHLVRGRRA